MAVCAANVFRRCVDVTAHVCCTGTSEQLSSLYTVALKMELLYGER